MVFKDEFGILELSTAPSEKINFNYLWIISYVWKKLLMIKCINYSFLLSRKTPVQIWVMDLFSRSIGASKTD